jgi:hypothetical protein
LATVNNVFKEEGLHYVTVAVGCLISDDVEPKVTIHDYIYIIGKIKLTLIGHGAHQV